MLHGVPPRTDAASLSSLELTVLVDQQAHGVSASFVWVLLRYALNYWLDTVLTTLFSGCP